MTSQEAYKILELTYGASEEDIKKAHRKLSTRYHPDHCSNKEEAEEKFKLVQTAYETLSNPEPFAGQGFAGFSDFTDIFNNFFSGFTRQSQRVPKGQDIFKDLELTLDEVHTGIRKEIIVEEREFCKKCEGRGYESFKQCAKCSGSGKAFYRKSPFNVYAKCTDCDGTGRDGQNNCADCSGTGSKVVKEKSVYIDIPAGIEERTVISCAGFGHPVKGGVTGNLYLNVKIKPHKYFVREGLDLHLDLPISYAESILGVKDIVINALDNKQFCFSIPPLTPLNKAFRVKNMGLKTQGHKGDIIINLKLINPETIDQEYKEILEKLRDKTVVDRNFLKED